MLPATVEVNPEWLMVRNITSPTVSEIDDALAATDLGAPRLQEDATAYDKVAVCNTTITPLALVQLFLGSPLLTPINTWNLVAERAASF